MLNEVKHPYGATIPNDSARETKFCPNKFRGIFRSAQACAELLNAVELAEVMTSVIQ
jgi:hypothetical protein